jgi:hypothetical protein
MPSGDCRSGDARVWLSAQLTRSIPKLIRGGMRQVRGNSPSCMVGCPGTEVPGFLVASG